MRLLSDWDRKPGIDLPQEVSGVMPSEEWKIRNFKQKWYAGETISVGIGQGAVAVTPMQLARAIGESPAVGNASPSCCLSFATAA
jgi:cell division protein FtsI/penicillin-binding protein 2